MKPDAILATNTSSPVGHRDLGGHPATRAGSSGMHFFNPAPVMKFVEVIRTVVTEDDDRRRRQGAGRNGSARCPVVIGDKAGFIANALLFGYLNHAVSCSRAVTPPGRTSTRRCGWAAAADGPARADGPHRARHGLRDPGHDVQAGTRPAARAVPHPQADGHRPGSRAARRAAASTPTRRPAAPRSSPTTSTPPAPGAHERGLRDGADRRRRRLRARWRPGSSRCSPRPGMTSRMLRAAQAKVEGVEAAIAKSLREGRPARQAGRQTTVTRPLAA